MKPTVILYNAVSLDGCTTGFPVDMGAFYGQLPRWGEDVTLAGSDTLIAATPPDAEIPEEGDAAGPDDPRPILAVVDSRGRLDGWAYWAAQPMWKNSVALGSAATPEAYVAGLVDLGVPYHALGETRVDLGGALTLLAETYGARTVRVESGGALNAALLSAELVDEVHLLVHPVIVGTSGRTRMLDQAGLAEPLGLSLNAVEQQDGGLTLLSYAVSG